MSAAGQVLTLKRVSDDPDLIDLAAVLRALRRRADLSQRELAALCGVPQATLARIESGRARDPKFRTVERLVRAAEARLTVTGTAEAVTGTAEAVAVAVASNPAEGRRDEGGRNYPAHLDVREVNEPKDWSGAWWAHLHNLPPERWPLRVPEWTYDLSRSRRDRRRHQEELRRGVLMRRVPGGDLPDRPWRWVAEIGGELVGELRAHRRGRHPTEERIPGCRTFPACREPPGYEVVLDGVVVAPECRGVGIGRRLVGELLAEMDRVGMMVARAFSDDPNAERFLVACGFRCEHTRPVRLTLSRRCRCHELPKG